ncbi:PKD domain-containing protein [candidate division KSB1 bacterium]|nr:PKD domain-containing protein [candidate division KSB1 bacterium]
MKKATKNSIIVFCMILFMATVYSAPDNKSGENVDSTNGLGQFSFGQLEMLKNGRLTDLNTKLTPEPEKRLVSTNDNSLKNGSNRILSVNNVIEIPPGDERFDTTIEAGTIQEYSMLSAAVASASIAGVIIELKSGSARDFALTVDDFYLIAIIDGYFVYDVLFSLSAKSSAPAGVYEAVITVGLFNSREECIGGYERTNVYITVNNNTPKPPVADFSGNPLTGHTPLNVQFTNHSSGEISRYEWDFGDGGRSAIKNPSHTFQSEGNFNVKLKVTGPGGTDTETKYNYVVVIISSSPPVADFMGTPHQGEVPLNVRFTSLSSGDITEYEWDFGDGKTSTLKSPHHAYTSAGRYTVKLKATGPDGSDTETKYHYVTVDSKAESAGAVVYFTDKSIDIDGELDWCWDGVPTYRCNVELYSDNATADPSDIGATFRLLWDNKNFYSYIRIMDDDLKSNQASGWLNDSVEFYFDGDNSKNNESMGYDRNDEQIRIGVNSRVESWGNIIDINSLNFFRKTTKDGWDLEVAFPFEGLPFEPVIGQKIGFDIHINDNDDGDRQTKLTWWSENDDSWKNPSVFGTIVLDDGSRVLVEPEQQTNDFQLIQNYPNPFNNCTQIEYHVPKTASVKAIVYDVRGNLVAGLVDKQQLAGHYSVIWNGRSNNNMLVASGVYFCLLSIGTQYRVIKMIYAR